MVVQRWPKLWTSVGPTLEADHIIWRWPTTASNSGSTLDQRQPQPMMNQRWRCVHRPKRSGTNEWFQFWVNRCQRLAQRWSTRGVLSGIDKHGYIDKYQLLSKACPFNISNYFILKAPENSTILLNFNDFDIRQEGETCTDYLEIRYVRLGQSGIR